MEAKKGWFRWLLVVIGVGLAVKTGINVWRLWKLGGRVTEAQKQVEQAEQENRQLSEKLEYVKSPEYIEKEARDKLGYGKPGETIVVLPIDENAKPQILNSKQDEAKWRKWTKLYLGI